jgi:tetratricopeptide (TPR) repeat protein
MSRIEDLEQRLANDPNSKIFVQLAEEYRKAGLHEQAITTCREGLEKHPNYFSARVALGRALLEAESLEEARVEFEQVLSQVPENLLALKFLGETYHGLGQLENALLKYRLASTLSPEDADLTDRMNQIEAALVAGQMSPPSAPGSEQAGKVPSGDEVGTGSRGPGEQHSGGV